MKKLVIVIIFSTLITSGVFGQSGMIRELTGEVELRHAGSSAFVTASAGDTITQNTIVSTGFRSSAVIVVGNSVITVRPLTRLTFAEIQRANNEENVNVNLQAGRVRVEVNPPAGTRSNLNVQSPSATASVRGTILEMDVETMTTVKGRVILSGSTGAGVIVTAGNTSFATAGGYAANPSVIAAQSTQPSSPIGTPASTVPTTTADTMGNFSLDIIY
jgi:hypothetical protein